MSYRIEGGKLTYAGRKLAGADPHSLRLFPEVPECAADANAVYCYGRKTALDPATFQVLGGRYARDADTICHLGEQRLSVIKGADPATFESLRGIYARDAKQAYAHGLALKAADAAAFRALADNLAVDGRRIYLDKSPERLDLRGYDLDRLRGAPLDDGYWYPRAWFLEYDGKLLHRFYDSDAGRVRLGEVEGADSASFVFLSRTYQRDARRIYCGFRPLREISGEASVRAVGDDALVVDDVVYWRDNVLEGADAATFAVVDRDNRYRDAHWLYDEHGRRLQPVPSAMDIDTALEALLPQLVAVAFGLLDRSLLYHVDGSEEDKLPMSAPPAFAWHREGARIVLNSGEVEIEGMLSDLRRILGRAWAALRANDGKTAGWRLETRPWAGSGRGDQLLRALIMALAPQLAEAAAALHRVGEREEAELLFAQMLAQDFLPKTHEAAIAVQVPIEVHARMQSVRETRLSISRSTYLSGGKELIARADWAAPDPLLRLMALQFAHDLISGTGNIGGFLKHVLPPLRARLPDEDRPAVRTQLLACLESAVAHGFVGIETSYLQLHADLRPLVEALVVEGVNPELNLLRLWECCEAADDDAAAQAAWEHAQALLGEHEPLPPMWSGLHDAFGNAAFWRIGGWLRLAQVLPTRTRSQYCLEQAWRELDALRSTHGRHEALDGYAYSWVEAERACERLGIESPYATPKPGNVVMKSQAREQAHKAPWKARGNVQRQRAGVFEEVPRLNLQGYAWYRFLGSTGTAQAGAVLGIECFLDGEPWGRRLECALRVTSPDGQVLEFTRQPFDLGIKSGTYVALREFGEPAPAGKYRLELSFPGVAKLKQQVVTAEIELA
ncbi:DKNYY domain-containing protein [Luteimonas salinilitoris]|uniref:DKNYY domain-containing protein n=1 Tax=Luteimonas salinilitoris TaxID=3237697 RepID=A0ABV4HV19_9GAMM